MWSWAAYPLLAKGCTVGACLLTLHMVTASPPQEQLDLQFKERSVSPFFTPWFHCADNNGYKHLLLTATHAHLCVRNIMRCAQKPSVATYIPKHYSSRWLKGTSTGWMVTGGFELSFTLLFQTTLQPSCHDWAHQSLHRICKYILYCVVRGVLPLFYLGSGMCGEPSLAWSYLDVWRTCHCSKWRMFCVFLFCRIVGGFEALTAMENVESDPKTDKPKVWISDV